MLPSGTNLDMHAVANLPDEFRDDPSALLRLQVGVTSAQTTAGNAITSNIDPKPYARRCRWLARAPMKTTSSWTVLTPRTWLLASLLRRRAPFRLTRFRSSAPQVAQPSPLYGGRSGAQTLITTKSGANIWHGNAYEYNRTARHRGQHIFQQTGRDTPAGARPEPIRWQPWRRQL